MIFSVSFWKRRLQTMGFQNHTGSKGEGRQKENLFRLALFRQCLFHRGDVDPLDVL